MLEKLTIVVEERREEEASFLKQQEEKQAKLEAFRQKLLEDGIDPAELLSTLDLNRNDHNKTCYNRSSD
ncbi:DNA-binding protein H-NS [Klebsiella pneumoniae]|nr:DNA-binding protein H-NS [Klebsiella pneumoniae]